MAPPGRRRVPPTHTLLPFLLLCVLFSSASAASAVLGIDLGTEYIKAALVKPGIPLEIVLTKDSKRKEAATLAFKPSRLQATDPEALPERLYGGDAIALAGRFPGDVYPNLKTLLGVDVGSEWAQEYQRRYPGLSVESMVRNETLKQATVAFKSQVFEKTEPPFMLEELLAMELKNIKANADVTAGQGADITDVVLTVPAFYTAEEKRALELAADLAGLRVLGLISDGLAVGVNYATSRTFPSISDGAAPEYHLVYDMGAGSTTATLLRFQGRTVKDIGKRNKTIQEVQVVSSNWKKDLGGDAWNQLIVDDMVASFVDTPKMKALDVMPIHVWKNAKTIARLWKEAERMRQVLSANSQTSATLEGLFFEDVNFKYQLSRAEFEELAIFQASQVSVPLVHTLEAAGISVQQLNSVILHGGAVRTPFVQKHLEAVAGGPSKIRTNVNADEAAVLGAAFKAAGLSPSFRVKDIRADDTSGFDVHLRWTSDGKERAQKVFTRKSLIGPEKQVPFKTQEDFHLDLTQMVDEREIPVLEVSVSNLTASAAQLKDKYACTSANMSTKLTMRLSPLDGLPEVLSGSVSCEVEATKEGGVMDNVKGLFGFGSKKAEDQEPLQEDDSADADTTSATLSTDEETSTSPSASTSTTDKATKPSSSIVVIPLSLTTRPLGLNLPIPVDQLTRIRTRLAKLDASDLARSRRAEALNTLESFTYRARDYITDPTFITHSTQEIRDTLEQKLNEASEWLYGDGVDAKLRDFQDRLKELKGIVEPVLKRREEASKRAGTIEKLNESLDQMKGMIKMVESSVEKAAEDAKQSAETEAAAAAAAASAASETESSASSEKNRDAEAEGDDELDDDPYSTTSTSTASTPESSETNDPSVISPYNAADLSSLQSSYDTVSRWLEEKLSAQSQLGDHDDPVVLVRELEQKTGELQRVIRDVVVKNIRIPAQRKGKGPKAGGAGAGKKSKAKKGKQGKSASASASATRDVDDGAETATSTSTPTSSSATASSASGSSHSRDEL
ncbi:hypothetical protein EPUS_02824 [Endocarpon pusillum Z07020]|uniref:Actin-like ATPase domain-containing protein n=1 Tax=Endocarpon pusillum (strain Z07020 / HMAS-L-300199) TaxID=1263415 RepID=U1G5D0_ENDPU|nr:uncharacterized protein EPUS_02824 [Endocarpon pusillum Z07020]ERF72542.1 hypothetical protein EPUS_02824 [Endocarpon pusillum Z07020]